MAKSPTPAVDDPNAPAAAAEPAKRSRIEIPGGVRPARVAADALKPIATRKIERAGLGKKKGDGRRSGGNFSLKLLTIKDEASGKTRELRVPLNMDYTDYPTIQDTEVVVEEAEEEYTSESVRDRILSMQEDPFWHEGRKYPNTNRDWPKNLGFKPFDPAWRNDEVQNGKGAWYQGPDVTAALENKLGITPGQPVGV